MILKMPASSFCEGAPRSFSSNADNRTSPGLAALVAVEERNLPCFAARSPLQKEFYGVLDSFGRGRGNENTGRILDEDLKAAGTRSATREDRIGFKR